MGMEFRVGDHTMTHKPMVEVMENGEFVAGIYGHNGGIRIVSKYLDGVDHELCSPPALVVRLSNKK